MTDANGTAPVMEEQVTDTQTIVQGPMASQVAIKMLGTNGGGYVNANAAHPFENPNPLSNFLQMLSIFAIPSAMTYYLGRMVKNQGHGWAVWAAMLVLFVAGALVCGELRSGGAIPSHRARQSIAADGNMEGKGGALRQLQLRALRHGDHGGVLRCGECDARFVHTPSAAWCRSLNMQLRRSGLRRCGRGPSTAC